MNPLLKVTLNSRADLDQWKQIETAHNSVKSSILNTTFRFKHPTEYPCVLVYKWRDDYHSVQDKLEYTYVYGDDISPFESRADFK